MDGAEGGEGGGKESRLLQIDPNCLQEALRVFFQPIKHDDPRLDFYAIYKKEATEYDTDYVKKYDEDLNTTLIFAGLFSAVSSAFVIDVHSKLEPDPGEQSAALLRAILLTLNQSAIPNETPTIPPAQEGPPSGIVTVTGLMYTSLLISLLAAFIAMLGKQWLNRYLRNAGGSMIERCGDRQLKYDGLKKWQFHLFIESLPVMLQVALLLLACGLCKHMASVNTPVAIVLITLTTLGVLFYLGVIIAGTVSYGCPFQTPVSPTLRGLWKKVGPQILHVIAAGTLFGCLSWQLVLATLYHMWEVILHQVFYALSWLPHIVGWYHFQSTSLPVVQLNLQEHTPWLAPLHSLWENIQCKILLIALHLPQIPSLPTTQEDPPDAIAPSPWLTPAAQAMLQKTNTCDVLCVSWILWNITDPEALDAAIRLAGTIRWFDDGLNAEPPYDLIVSSLKTCFDSTGKIYPGSRDRAYSSAQAILWIHICAQCVSEEFALRFPLPSINCDTTSLDEDLRDLLMIYIVAPDILAWMFGDLHPKFTPAYSEWISNALLHLSWAKQSVPGAFGGVGYCKDLLNRNTIQMNTLLNYLLASCLFLGSPIDKEVLKIKDKSDHSEQILSRFSQAMVSAIHTFHPQCRLLQYILCGLVGMENQPDWLTKMAYEWCSVICENYQNLADGQNLLHICLEIGFRYHYPKGSWTMQRLTHTKYHHNLANIIFTSGNNEAIADLLVAWTLGHRFPRPHGPLNTCVGYFIHFQKLQPFSSRLRQLLIHSIGVIGYEGFEEVGVEVFISLLDSLHVEVNDVEHEEEWIRLILGAIQSSEATQHLSCHYWDLLVELAIIASQWPELYPTYNPWVTRFLKDAQEWDKLKCWLGVVWMVWPPKGDETMEKDLECGMLSLFHQQPSAIQKLQQWMGQWDEMFKLGIPKAFEQICNRAHLEIIQQETQVTLSINGGTGGPPHPVPATLPLFSGDTTF